MEVKVYPIKDLVTRKEAMQLGFYDLEKEPRIGIIQKFLHNGVVVAFSDGTLEIVGYGSIRHNLGE